MGRKLDALFGRNFKVSKFKTVTKLAISRIAILSNQHQIRLSHARSDVKELLQLNHQERALLRVDHVIKEQNMLDAFAMIEFYCHLLLERVKLIGKKKGESCPEELKEAVASLIYAASRCGEFPEIQKIREILTSKFGKDMAARAVELRNNCGVSPKMVQKFSTQRPRSQTKMKVLKQIASECGVTLDLEEDDPVNDYKQEQTEDTKAANVDDTALKLNNIVLSEEIKQSELFSESIKARRKYKDMNDTLLSEEIKHNEQFSESIKARKYRDVADAAQEAFESAAHAAAAARAAVELSMSKSIDKDSEDYDGSDNQGGTVSSSELSSTAKAHMINSPAATREVEHLEKRPSSEKIQPVEKLLSSESESESEGEIIADVSHNNFNVLVVEKKRNSIKRKPSTSNSFAEKRDNQTLLEQHDLDTFWTPSFPVNRLSNATSEDHLSKEDSTKFSDKSTK